ncbi:hypothetical protein AAEX28_13820 [Lentisphaerota bacterium WC36G]|nr:hypothetical protein LJT99_00570 [Lentisphaerae bacterium WC36]
MNISFAPNLKWSRMEPIASSLNFSDIEFAGFTIQSYLNKIFTELNKRLAHNELEISIKEGFIPSRALVKHIGPLLVQNIDIEVVCATSKQKKEVVLTISKKAHSSVERPLKKLVATKDCVLLKYPWDLLALNEQLIKHLKGKKILGTVRECAVIDGVLHLGAGSVILPGVYIEGNVIIGKNCKIGPNCYIRGNTSIGDNCHIGQSVEVKNSLIMSSVNVGHLSYVGDSVVCPNVNFGAGTIISNFRHDGKNHHSMVNNVLIDTMRRKFGAIIGSNVFTGINTSIYCGRKIFANKTTRPCEVVKKDLQ